MPKITTETTATANHCPHCGEHHECASSVPGNQQDAPHVGAASICINCGEASMFTEDLSLRLPTANEAAHIADDERIQRAQKLIRHMNQEN